jgi:membrane protein implicated in regulation of membrane protease activity
VVLRRRRRKYEPFSTFLLDTRGISTIDNEYISSEEGGPEMDWWLIWLIAAGALIVIEMLTLTFYLLWLGIGTLAAAVVAIAAPEAILLQVIVGSVVALVLTVFTKPLTRRFHNGKGFKDAVDDLVGLQGTVVEDIHPDAPGIVKVGSETWSAKSEEEIGKGETVIVVHRGSAFLQVNKWGG